MLQLNFVSYGEDELVDMQLNDDEMFIGDVKTNLWNMIMHSNFIHMGNYYTLVLRNCEEFIRHRHNQIWSSCFASFWAFKVSRKLFWEGEISQSVWMKLYQSIIIKQQNVYIMIILDNFTRYVKTRSRTALLSPLVQFQEEYIQTKILWSRYV